MKCPNCGYSDEHINKPKNNAMSHYLYAEGPLVGKSYGILNDDDVNISVTIGKDDNKKTLKLVREDVWKKQQNEKVTKVADAAAPKTVVTSTVVTSSPKVVVSAAPAAPVTVATT